MPAKKRRGALVKWFERVGMRDVGSVGGKNASLGEMIRRLSPLGVPVPGGFAVTADAYWRFIEAGRLKTAIRNAFRGLDTNDIAAVQERGALVRGLMLQTELPEDVRTAIAKAYREFCRREGRTVSVAVRSSATAEDLPGASFAGQQETYLNVSGEEALLQAVRKCFASLFTNRAIVYREEQGFGHLEVALSVGVQKMVRSDLASSGVIFTIDTESGFKDAIVINASYGLGESVVQGKVNPDQFIVFKPTLKQGFFPIIGRSTGSKRTKIVYGEGPVQPTRTLSVPRMERERFCLKDGDVIQLAKWAALIEAYYSRLAKTFQPMDIEWAKDGKTGQLYIVQARPETVQVAKSQTVLEEYRLKAAGRLLAKGLAIGTKIGQGNVRLVKSLKAMKDFKDGDVLVTRMTDPDWVPIMKRASAIVTDSGGRTCHAAIVSRELGTPAVVGSQNATKILKEGQAVTVSCAYGEEGKVFAGRLPFEVRRTELKRFKKPRTQIMMNVAQPDLAFGYSFIPNQGVGLARIEFIFADDVKIHPLALLHFNRLKDAQAKRNIAALTSAYRNKSDYFVDRLAEGMAKLAAAFYPRDVIVRASDFKTNEYANLIGGREFEPVEANPMIGWRGASRYYDPHYEEAFLLECRAFRKVRDVMGLTNVVLMVPFCRTPEEGKAVLKVMAKAGLRRGKNGLRVYVMVEIPSNIILADRFAEIFDGFSIGSNDLTQLTLGVDRDSSLVSHLYDEQSPAVLDSIRRVIHTAKQKNIKIGICGQAPSDYPTFAEFLVSEGIDSISLNPDTVIKTSLAIAKMEQKRRRR